jgi:uncharacterized membrane protein YhaH (DUF805 family)
MPSFTLRPTPQLISRSPHLVASQQTITSATGTGQRGNVVPKEIRTETQKDGIASPSLLEQACECLYETSHPTWTISRRSNVAAATSPSSASTSSSASASSHSLSLCSPALLLICLFALLIRYGVSGGGYSGAGGPLNGSPIYGDYEAQRHWMEITVNLPLSEWYEGKHNANDLQYWGLDYPPLTAYVSMIFGYMARFVGVPQLVELQTSRGYESAEGKLFMRLTVILCDICIYFPAIILAIRAISDTSITGGSERRSSSPPSRILALIFIALIQPASILIDHGHFQSVNTDLTLHHSSLFRLHIIYFLMVSFVTVSFFIFC